MEKIKYTTDGKKVIVIDNLNQSEKIVQEIFVTQDGAEIPAGEHFIVKSLLDQPAKSWKERQLEDFEKSYSEKSDYWNKKLNDLDKEKQLCYSRLQNQIKWLKGIMKQPLEEQVKDIINTVTLFLQKKQKWVFHKGWNWNIYNWNDKEAQQLFEDIDYSRSEMRLVTLFGKSNGNLEWKINTFSDGSGTNRDIVAFYADKKDALDAAQAFINEQTSYTEHDITTAKKFGLKLNESILKKQNEDLLKSYQSDIEAYKKKIADTEKQIKNLETK
jgi:hypothetical protein